MYVTLLVLHRKESYPGQHAPEVVAVVDEWILDENPDWWTAEIERQKGLVRDDASAWAEVTISFPTEALMSALYPKSEEIPATIVRSKKA